MWFPAADEKTKYTGLRLMKQRLGFREPALKKEDDTGAARAILPILSLRGQEVVGCAASLQ